MIIRNAAFQAALAVTGGSFAMEPRAFAETFFPAHQDAHVKEFRLEQKLAASRHITTEMLLADLRASRRRAMEG